MKLLIPDKFIPAIYCWLALTFCVFSACNNSQKQTEAEKQIDLLAPTDRLSIVAREKMLPYADSVYRAQKHKTPYLKAGRLMAYSNYYDLKAQYAQSTPYVDSAIAIIANQDLTDSTWTNYYFAANIHKAVLLFKTGHYSSAINIYSDIKGLADRPGNKCRIGYKLDNNIGLILYKQQKFDEARRYFMLAYNELKECSADKYVAGYEQQFLDNVGLGFVKQGNADSALAYYRRALHVTIADSDKFSRDAVQNNVSKQVSRGVIITNMAQVFVKQNKLDSAEMFIKKNIVINALTFKNEIKYAQLSQLYLADLYDLRKQYPKMRETLASLRKSLDTIHNDEVELGWRKSMAVYAGKNNLPLEELKFNNRYLAFKDSLNEARLANTASDISKELKAKGQQMDIILLQKDNELSHLYLWITIALSVMALAIVALVYYYYRKGKKKNDALSLLNSEVSEQNDKLEFAMVELEKSNTDKERILKVVAHDLRDPIGGVASLVDTILNDDLPEEDEKQSLRLIERSLGNSLTLINELLVLDFGAEQIKLHKEPVDINETVIQCTALMQLIADKKHQQLKFTPLPEPLTVRVDKKKIERTINNLVGNAIKFSPAGEKISISLQQKNNAVIISVADNGIGIPPEMRGELFNKFGNTRRMGTAGEKSFGLGLSVCKQIVEAHSGKIWVKSEPQAGTVFYVELPLGYDI
ncbi:tetratricopeptide repeat-containing sensor histidine kinase [Mucilaginibacter sp.]|uniref:tetratricopeptide repeat-containing sensor histidine kinase n=1 Tax=Mucilaginibacter sp. TaxID=1882438 RepID=UPI0025EE65B8|nr:tetratricopeptide repeat-containing sensor histidine kinase [Mucilaginibacter sp.]